MKTILITGGAGYIGSFMIKRLLDDGYSVLVADSLERGHKDTLDSRAHFKQGNLLDNNFIESLFSGQDIDAVMHFAAYIAVGESMANPGMYLKNNILSAINLLDEMKQYGVKKFIFSSTGTVYGSPKEIPMSENHPKDPENPYAESKFTVERILRWYQQIVGINYVALRYFNAAGGAIDGALGEDHDPETHLIPNVLRSMITDEPFILYGDDYETEDGTCIRDYIHVLDLVEAHMLALRKISTDSGGFIYNVGTGNGHSNKEVIDMAKKISELPIKIDIKSRREGDVAISVADPSLIMKELGFSPRYSDLETIIKTAWKWHSRKLKADPDLIGVES